MRLLKQMVVAGYYKKALMAAVCLCIALFAGNGSVSGQGAEVGSQKSEVRSQKSEVGSQKSEVGSQEFCEERFGYFNDFIVYLKDDRRQDRILVCDVVIELNQGMKLPQERIELRKIIYNTLKKFSGSLEIKRSLKEKIKIGLNNFMSDEIIKNVYFTKFILL